MDFSNNIKIEIISLGYTIDIVDFVLIIMFVKWITFKYKLNIEFKYEIF